MKKTVSLTFIAAAFLMIAPAVHAQQNADKPIEITAVKSVEWLRNDQKYVARQNVVVTQGTMKLMADLVTADYREGEKSSTEIWQLTAEGNVTIVSDGNTATGDKAVYNVTDGIATLTGQNLKLVSPDQTVTATEKMEYYANTRQARAIGNAKVVRAQDTLSADTITAIFKDTNTPAGAPSARTPAGTGSLERIDAAGNVVIVTPTETLRGAKGTYRADSNTAELTGKVKIVRGPNILEGDRAEVNLTTNVSKMFGNTSSGGDGRVRGVFFPGSDKKPAKTSVPAAPETAPLPDHAAPATVAPQQ